MKRFEVVESALRRLLQAPLLVVCSCALVATDGAEGQTLTVTHAGEATEVIVVAVPLTEVAVACWPEADQTACVCGSDLVFLNILEAALTETAVPEAMVVVGGSAHRDVVDALRRIFGDRAPTVSAGRSQEVFEEGGQERRLGAPGSNATLRLQIPMPPAQLRARSAMTVLWGLLARALEDEHPGLRAHVLGDTAELEMVIPDESPEFALRRLRLSLARMAAEPNLKSEEVDMEAHRLRIARRADLEKVEPTARLLVDLWSTGGAAGVREFLFGLDGVTLSTVEGVARDWLAQHPGHAEIVLPPHVFRPRFLPPPREVQLENDVTVAVLERPDAGLSALVLRPVLLSGLGGDAESVILTRVAGALRTQEHRPPYIDVETAPPRLELAAAEDEFPMLCESLQEALDTVSSDQQEVAPADDARGRALRLMSGVLGLDTRTVVTPATVLTPGNLAIGVVGPDSEAAVDGLRKFGVGGPAAAVAALSSAVGGEARRRLPAAGSRSVVVVAGELSGGFPVAESVGAAIQGRIERTLEETRVETILPLVPGRAMVVVVVEREGTVEQLETALASEWQNIVAPVDESELEIIRRAVAGEATSLASGVLGRARACARVACGANRWRSPSETEMLAMTVDPETVNAGLGELSDPDTLEWTASGPLPVSVAP